VWIRLLALALQLLLLVAHLLLLLCVVLAQIQGGHVHLTGVRLGPVDGQNVAEIASDGPPHSGENKIGNNECNKCY